MKIFIGVMVFMAFALPASASFQSQEDFSKWLTNYYKNPEPEKIPGAIKYMSESGMLDKENAIAPIFGFLAGSFGSNPEQVTGWVNSISSITERHHGVVILGLWYANLPDSQKRVYEILDSYPKLKGEYAFIYEGSPMSVEDIPLEQGPWVLDALWGYFMATGNKTPILRIMEALPWTDIKGDINRLMVGGAAQWSLMSNAVQHKRIMEICEKEIITQPKNVSDKLDEIVEKAKEELKNRSNKSL